MRAQNISRRLTLEDAIDIWRRRAAGEAYSRLAFSHDVNQGRIADVLKGRLFPEAKALARVDNAELMKIPVAEPPSNVHSLFRGRGA